MRVGRSAKDKPKPRKYPGRMRCRGCGRPFASPDRRTVDCCTVCQRTPPSRPGRVRCLHCQHTFLSPDRRSVRVCPDCKREPERVGKSGESAVSVHGVGIPAADDD